MRSIGFALLLGFSGAFVGALWTFVIGIAGGPGAMLASFSMNRKKSDVVPTSAFLLTLLGQLYVSLVFVVCVVSTARNHLALEVGVGKWIAWVVAFGVATLPSMVALKDSAGEQNRTIQHLAAPLTSLLSVIGFFVFVFSPRTIPLFWGWVPSF